MLSAAPTATPRPFSRLRAQVVLGAGLAFLAGQGFARFGLTLILPEMRLGLGMSYADLGLLAGAGFGAYLICAPLSGAAAAHHGPRRVVSVSLLASGLGLMLTGLASSLPAVLLAQVLNGAAGAGIIIPILGLSPGWFERRYWARATGVIVGFGGLGLALSGLLVPTVLRQGGPEAWRVAWLALGSLLFLTALVAALLLRDPPRAADFTLTRPGLRAVYRSPAVWWIGLAFASYGVAFAVYGTFFGVHLVGERQLSPQAAGLLWTLAGLASVGSGLLGGWLGDRFGRRRPLAGLFFVQGLALAMLALATDLPWFVLSALLYGLTVWGFPAVLTAATADVVGPDLTPAAAGLTVFCFAVGQALGPPTAGLAAELAYSFAAALLIGAVADLVGLLVVASLPHAPRTAG